VNDWKRCENCEGEGLVTRWGLYGHEVPASRRWEYPRDVPQQQRDADGDPRQCEECHGYGGWEYDLDGRRVFMDKREPATAGGR